MVERLGALKEVTLSCFLLVTELWEYEVVLYSFVKLGGHSEGMMRVGGLQPFLYCLKCEMWKMHMKLQKEFYP